MIRYEKSDFEEIGDVSSGTAALFIGRNNITGKKGVYKINGAMLGIENEDVREKLASDVLNEIGKECAQIDLVYDKATGETACFSNYIITEDEELIEPYVVNNRDSGDKIQDFVDSYIEGIKQVTSDEKFLEECKKNAYEKIYIGCVLDTYDLKSDNLPFIHNNRTGEYKIAPWFDHGTAFKPDALQKQNFFITMSAEEVLENLFSNHYNEIKDIASSVNEKLNIENIEKIFSKDYVRETFQSNELNEIKSRFENQVELSNSLLDRYKEYEKSTQENIKDKKMFSKIKSFFSKIFARKSDIKMLNEPVDYNQKEKEDLAKLGYNSVEEMNQDDPDITILDNELFDLVNTAQEIADAQEKRELIEETKGKEISDMLKE